jgi:hypothetical protein
MIPCYAHFRFCSSTTVATVTTLKSQAFSLSQTSQKGWLVNGCEAKNDNGIIVVTATTVVEREKDRWVSDDRKIGGSRMSEARFEIRPPQRGQT